MLIKSFDNGKCAYSNVLILIKFKVSFKFFFFFKKIPEKMFLGISMVKFHSNNC
jgi:hypothetical protein